MDQRVTILRRELGTSTTGSGLGVEEWHPVVLVWAQVIPLRGNELFAGNERTAEATLRVRVRYRELDPTWRIEWRGQQYDIVEARPGGQRLREWLDLFVVGSEATNPAR